MDACLQSSVHRGHVKIRGKVTGSGNQCMVLNKILMFHDWNGKQAEHLWLSRKTTLSYIVFYACAFLVTTTLKAHVFETPMTG